MKEPHDIDGLRERLRALGYLDAPVDRYVLGSASARGGAMRFAVSAGLRVGLIAGLLLGLSAAIALAVRAPGFIASRRDAIVLAAALCLVFTIVATVAVAASVMAASWFARRSAALNLQRARRIAAAAGIIVALASAAYLTLWWNSAQDVFTGLTFTWNAVALAVAAAVALLLAHAVSVVVLAALARASSSDGIPAGGLLSSRWFLVAFGVVLFAGSAALLSSGSGRDARADAPAITVTPTGYALRVIAIDGVDEVALTAFATREGLRALPRLMSGKRVPFHRLSIGAPDPARDWTSIATGQPPSVHGIASLEARLALGIDGRLSAGRQGISKALIDAADLLRLTRPAVASGEQRRAPAFWEVAAAAGLRTSVVNWWATWPAPEGDDIVFTDRAILRLDTGGALDAEIAPAATYVALRARWATMRREAAEQARDAFASIANPELRALLQRSAELDILTAALGRVTPDAPLDLRVVYLAGLDIAQFQMLQGSNAGTVSAMSERVAAVEAYYRFLDALIAPLLEPSRTHIDVAILWPGRTGSGDGALAIAGEPVGEGMSLCEDCVVGAAPTLAYLLGLPIAEDLASRPPGAIVRPEFQAKFPERYISTYAAALTRASLRTGQPLDAEALERLRSLGYIR